MEKVRLGSNRTPRFLAVRDGWMVVLAKFREGFRILTRCWGVPMIRNSVLEGLRKRKLLESQIEIVWRVVERARRAEEEFEAEKER